MLTARLTDELVIVPELIAAAKTQHSSHYMTWTVLILPVMSSEWVGIAWFPYPYPLTDEGEPTAKGLAADLLDRIQLAMTEASTSGRSTTE